MTRDKVVIHHVNAPGAKAKFEEWIERGDAIGVFVNQDLGHLQVGHTIFMPIDYGEGRAGLKAGIHAPDGDHGLGWRYKLMTVTKGLGMFEFAVPQTDGRCSHCKGPVVDPTPNHERH